MAIYHFSAKMISRANGSSALAAAAYRSASRLHDHRLDRAHDFSNKAGVVHSEIVLPDGAPQAWREREALWNAVEAAEFRKDAQLAREVEFALPRELTQADCIELARDFVQHEFVDRGMVADLNVHCDVGTDGEPKPHAHVMLTTREITSEGLGAKVRDWNRTELLTHWREAWAEHFNRALAARDIDVRVDHRTLEAQGIDLEPQHKIGPAAARMAEQGLSSERLEEHHAIARSNGEKLLANPGLAPDAITHTQATFTTRDLARFVHRHSKGKEQFDQVMAAVKAAPELVALGKDGRGEQRFTSRAMIETEQRLERATDRLAARCGGGLPAMASHASAAIAGRRGLILGVEQQAALSHITGKADLAIVIGYAGTGKSAMLSVAREAWEQAGYRVQGAALSGIAAENLETSSGITSRTIAGLEHQWNQGRELLSERSVLVIDEAGLIGTRQMERVISEAEKRGARVVLVGDPQQLQSIEAGAAFRSLAERHGALEITQVRRQREEWQREATRHLATERTGEAITAYESHGHIHAAETREDARNALIAHWDRERQADPDPSRIILAHSNEEVQALNHAARARLLHAGALGEETVLKVERGERSFASGDRVIFLRNERGLDVRNGSLGTVRAVTTMRMAVLLDDGRQVAFDLKHYDALDHGYATTIHKAQGMTVDRVHVLATPGLDAHASYVALSRHRDRVDLHYAGQDFADRGKLVRILSRERVKDMASDYRPILEKVAEVKQTPARNIFAGIDLRGVSQQTSPLEAAVERHGRLTVEILATRAKGIDMLAHQGVQLKASREQLDAIHPNSARYLEAAIIRNPTLMETDRQRRAGVLVNAMSAEVEIRAAQKSRADRFVADWNRHAGRIATFERQGENWRADAHRNAMSIMAKELHRDPQLESMLHRRAKELNITPRQGTSISQELQQWLGRSRGRGIGI
jgi:Ti-type conjugative transfer relaxase TraA